MASHMFTRSQAGPGAIEGGRVIVYIMRRTSKTLGGFESRGRKEIVYIAARTEHARTLAEKGGSSDGISAYTEASLDGKG